MESYNAVDEIMSKSQSMNMDGLYYLINIILFGSVIIFVAFFVYNFIKAYKGDETVLTRKKNKKTNKISSNSMRRFIKGSICEKCGENNELDAKFCKNCGNKMK